MLSDEAKPYATTERVTAIVNIIWKVLGLDKTKIDVSGEVKTTTDVTKLKQVLNTLPLEERIRLSEQLEELEDVGK
jgi:deoxyribose-phosphate aldolase